MYKNIPIFITTAETPHKIVHIKMTKVSHHLALKGILCFKSKEFTYLQFGYNLIGRKYETTRTRSL